MILRTSFEINCDACMYVTSGILSLRAFVLKKFLKVPVLCKGD